MVQMGVWDDEQDWGIPYNEIGGQWFRDHVYELYQEHYEQAVKEFKVERLRSFFVGHSELILPAFNASRYSRSLLADHPKAALVFAAVAIELSIKKALLEPIVYGLVHIEGLAAFITTLVAESPGMGRFWDLFKNLLREVGDIDFKSFKRRTSNELLWQEIQSIQKTRNRVLHRGDSVDASYAELAVAVSETALNEIIPQVLEKIGLHLHDPGVVCSSRHTSEWYAHFKIGEFIAIRVFPSQVELDDEHMNLEYPPATVTGRVRSLLNPDDLARMRSETTTMLLRRVNFAGGDNVIRYRIALAAESLEFVGTKIHEIL